MNPRSFYLLLCALVFHFCSLAIAQEKPTPLVPGDYHVTSAGDVLYLGAHSDTNGVSPYIVTPSRAYNPLNSPLDQWRWLQNVQNPSWINNPIPTSWLPGGGVTLPATSSGSAACAVPATITTSLDRLQKTIQSLLSPNDTVSIDNYLKRESSQGLNDYEKVLSRAEYVFQLVKVRNELQAKSSPRANH